MIAVLVVAVLGLIAVLMFPSNMKITAKIINDKTGVATPVPWPGDQVTSEAYTALSAVHLESYPAGTTVQAGTSGNATNIFRIGDLMGVSATLPSGGGYGACCISFPQEVGNYTLIIYANNNELKSLAFRVVS
ncbi:MAG: hypothetical protein KGH74_01045 [Candidatus Micrarchaeota archaeon]|nr:hypothetical protein [Candidatus Micrarchaeota archaeon]MDE1823867.1 hypothetical protein [Candidatus Micrarchaeota archaeon]